MNISASRCISRTSALAVLLLTLGVLASPGAAAAQDAPLTGDWVLSVESPNGVGERSVTFLQEGTKLTGDIASSQAAGPLSGTVDGNKVTFVAIVQMDSGPFEITYAGTVEGDQITGTVEFGSYGAGTFTGHRVEGGAPTQG